jgi:hypothetical protein
VRISMFCSIMFGYLGVLDWGRDYDT